MQYQMEINSWLLHINVNVGILFEPFVQTIYMEKDIKINLEAPWEVVKERMKESNIDLTDADLEYEPGIPRDIQLKTYCKNLINFEVHIKVPQLKLQ